MPEDTKSTFENIFGKVDRDFVTRLLWGFILKRLSPFLREKIGKSIGESVPSPVLREAITDLFTMIAQILEKGGGLWRDIASDIFENISGGVGIKKEKGFVVELSLEILKAIKEDPSIQNKRIFLESFASPPLRDKVKEIKDEDIDLFIDTLIRLQELQEEIKKEFKIELSLRELWSAISQGFNKLNEALKEKYPEAKEEIKRQIDEGRRGWDEGRRKLRGKGLLPL
jgi:hypothetical protein